ncbi:tyrosine-type recombinase/integrase [Staphylococcus xylosus]|uniref:tyrosine-type recombinase/integrase n=1 Tax=Staphylococcus xylosus TaxID=1288 RepID=UPI000D1D396F|nr:site-specific integrase [Staphylococcus xylosus]PTH96999.1 integrase [Staphylococcus xylosus]
MNNIIEITNCIEEKLGIDIVNEFALESGINSERTVKAYREDAKQFIQYNFHGNYTIVGSVLAKSLNRNNIISFRSYLLDNKKLTASTVKRKLASIQELIKYMYSLGYDVNISLMQSLSKIKSVKNSYEVLSIEEANILINNIKDNEKRNSESKYFYCLLAFDTGIRAEALNKLTPASFIEKDDEVLIRGIDKGKKSYIKSISKEFYKSMKVELNIEDKEFDQCLFNFSEKNRHDMVKRAKERLGWVNRNITFHSFKKGAVTYAYESTKDIQIARKVGSHASLNTTQMYLADSEEIFKGAVSNNYSIKNKNIKFEDYSNEDLIKVLNNLPEAAQLQIKTFLSDLK